MKRLISLLIGCLSTFAFAQTPSAPISGMAVNQQGQPIPNAQIRVCLVSSTGIPCTPTATIYQDFALTTPIANPTQADQYGNYLAYVGTGSPNLYTIQVSADQGLTWTYVQNGPPPLGTVTGVALTMPSSIFAVSGSPCTTNCALGVTLQPQAANTFLAGPASGSSVAPTFRTIGSADLPLATSSAFGAVKPDNSTIGVTAGVISVIGGGSGVTEIIPGSNVSCTPVSSGHCVGAVTVNASGGGGGGGVGTGVQGNFSVYSTTTAVGGVSSLTALSDSTQFTPTFGVLTYAGLGGATFTTGAGGNFLFNSSNSAATFSNAVSQFVVQSTLGISAAPSQNPGLISLTTRDNVGSNDSSNMVLSAQESGSAVGSANIGISATGAASSTQSGNVNISSDGSGVDNLSGNINLTASSASITSGIGGGNINISTSGLIGATPTANVSTINLNANSGFSPITITASNWQVDLTGDLFIGGTLQATSLAASPGCLQSDSSGNVTPTGLPCGSGGGGGIGGTGTAGSYSLFSASTTIGNGHLSDSGSLVTSSLPLLVADSSGTGGAAIGTLGNAPTASGSTDTFWADTGGFWKMNNSNTGAASVMGIATPGTAGHCVALGSNGIYGVDSGGSCASSSTPTATAAGSAAANQLQMSYASSLGRLESYGANTSTVGTLSLIGATSDGTTTVAYFMQCTTAGCTFNQPSIQTASIQPSLPATSVSCSTSGTANFAQPFAGTAYKMVTIHLAACQGTASYTYTHAFTNTPWVSGNIVSAVSSANTTAVNISASSSTTGYIQVQEQQ